MAPEFIGGSKASTLMPPKKSYATAHQSPDSSKKKRGTSIDRSVHSLRSSVEYDAPLPTTGLNILDSIPKMDSLAVRDPAKNGANLSATA